MIEDTALLSWRARRKIRTLLKMSGIEFKEHWRPTYSVLVIKATPRDWKRIENWGSWFA